MGRSSRYSPEVRERAVRMVFEHQAEHESQWAAMASIASKIGCTAETLRKWVRQAERDTGRRAGLTTDEKQRLKELERENRELKRAKRDPEESIGIFRAGGTRPPRKVVTELIDRNRSQYGVESMCSMLHIAPSTYYEHAARRRDPDRLPARTKRDASLCVEIDRVWRENRQVCGARKVWKQLNREGQQVVRCTVARLMRDMGLQGVVRGRKFKTTIADDSALRPPRSCRSGLHSDPTESAMGRGSDLRGDVAWIRVRRLRHRRVLPEDRRLENDELAED